MVARAHQIAHELSDAQQIRSRFPQLAVTNEHGYYGEQSGYVIPEECLEAQLKLAGEQGATIKLHEMVTSWTSDGRTVEVMTDRGTYSAEKLVMATGPWIRALVPELEAHLKVFRQVLYWFDIADKTTHEKYRPAH